MAGLHETRGLNERIGRLSGRYGKKAGAGCHARDSEDFLRFRRDLVELRQDLLLILHDDREGGLVFQDRRLIFLDCFLIGLNGALVCENGFLVFQNLLLICDHLIFRHLSSPKPLKCEIKPYH